MTDRLQVDMIVNSVTKGFEKTKTTLTELNSAFSLIQRGAQLASKAYDFLIADTIAYAKESKDLSIALGLTTQETQKLIQVADDYGIEQGQLTTALEMAVKRGYRPSIDNLAKLADETNAIKDPVERAAKLTEIFGKGWTTLVPLLNAGGDAMRAGAKDAEKLGLVLSGDAMQGAEDLRVGIDTLEDRITGLKNSIASGLIPVLNNAMDGFDLITDSVSVAKTKDDEYRQAIIQLSLAFGAESHQVKEVSAAYLEYLQNNKAAADGTQAYADVLGVESKALDTSTAALSNNEAQLYELNTVQSLVTLGSQALTREFIFNQAAAGLDSEAALQLGLDMGVLNQATVDAVITLDGLKQTYDTNKDGAISAGEAARGYSNEVKSLGEKIDNLKDKTVNVYVKVHEQGTLPEGHTGPGGSTPGYASGANFIVPPGYPNDSYPMRVQSGEHVTVTPANQVSNQYTMNVTTSSPVSPVREFGLMKAMAGAL